MRHILVEIFFADSPGCLRDFAILKSDASSKGSDSSTHMFRRASVALEAIKKIEDEIEDEILLPRSLSVPRSSLDHSAPEVVRPSHFTCVRIPSHVFLTLQRNSDGSNEGNDGEPSARMFENARDVRISGGEFYSARSVSIGKTLLCYLPWS